MKNSIRYLVTILVTIVLIFAFVMGSKTTAQQQYLATVTMESVSATSTSITDELCPRCGDKAYPSGRCVILVTNVSLPFNVKRDEQHLSTGCANATIPSIDQTIGFPLVSKSWCCLNCGFKKIMFLPVKVQISEKGVNVIQ